MNRRRKKKTAYVLSFFLLITVILSGCSGHGEQVSEKAYEEDYPDGIVVNEERENEAVSSDELSEEELYGKEVTTSEQPEEAFYGKEVTTSEQPEEVPSANEAPAVEIIETDWSQYFGGLNGAAVVYDSSEGTCMIYNEELAMTRRSPCSTFKIISSLLALENGILDPDDSVRAWSGEIFWNENWNRDIGFADAFQTSCVWYFREVIDEIGKDRMQAGLEKISYGNCDISDWEGRLNTNNNNRALTGFWIESSLQISPKEQTEVMARIFGGDTGYAAETINRLKQVMLVEDPIVEQNGTNLSVYGKTGMGKAQGVTVDAWFTGFAGTPAGNLYFCVYLGQTDGMDVTSSAAKEIALRILADYHS
ncbi:MAG: class D beta-lactamase [Lachnospiraceae bacterium]|nr:class D beta-lactamase [Lachnospiraceae bacterium]